MEKTDFVIEVDGLVKRYGSFTAVDEVSFQVQRGEIFGVVGPNGAGKTTTIECLAGLRKPQGGRLRVLGLDPVTQERDLRRRLGLQLQHAALPDDLRVWEAVDLFASFYSHSVEQQVLLETWGLAEKTRARFASLSGGQKQRLFIALALVNDPELVILDELTSGLDPQARRGTWELVERLREQGKTVLLVTHSMEEAERLCDRVAIIDHGRILALDSPQNLVRTLKTEQRVRFAAPPGFDLSGLNSLPAVQSVARQNGDVLVSGGGALLVEVVTALSRMGFIPSDLRTEQSSLEDVFLALTGSQIRDSA